MRIHVIGLGAAQRATLLPDAERALLAADRVLGSTRQWQTVAHLFAEDGARERFIELPPLGQLDALLQGLEVQSLAVLASGDPLYYGIGSWFSRHYVADALAFYPAVSSIQAACHALQLPLQGVDVVSLHGRKRLAIRRWLRANRTLLVLTDTASGPAFLASECARANFEESRIHVCERLGYNDQRVRQFSVQALQQAPDFDPLTVVVLETAGQGGVYPEAAGIPDEDYITGAEPGRSMITKREVRLVVLSLLQPRREEVIWDLGAGCGGIAVELALAERQASVYAVEQSAERSGYLEQNRDHFGVVDNLHIDCGRASAALAQLPDPDKVFIGGSDGELEVLLRESWRRLPPQGACVCTAVTDSTRQSVEDFAARQADCQLEGSEVAVRRRKGADAQWVSKLPVTVYHMTKTQEPT